MNTEKYSILGYTILGVVFGCLFPLLATTYYVSWQELELTYISVINAQISQPLLWIIDTAPVFLGIFASMAGVNKFQERKLSNIKDEIQEGRERLELYAHKLHDISQYKDVVNINLEGVFPKLAQDISEIFGVDKLAIWLTNKENKSYDCTMLSDFSGDVHQTYQSYFNLSSNSMYSDIMSLKHRKFIQLTHVPSKGEPLGLSPYLDLDFNSKEFNISVFPILKEGEVIGIICCGFNDLERKWKGDEVNFIDSISNLIALLLCAKERNLAENAHMAKSEFLAVISHELRTPLNIISGYNDLILKKAKKSDKHHDHSCEIRSSAQALKVIIDDILDMAKIEMGVIELDKAPFSLSKLVEFSSNPASKSATNKKVSLECKIEDNVPSDLIGDEARIKQIIYNLIDNAVKFTEIGSVKVCISIKDSNTKFITLRFDVDDTGTGIEQENLIRIFDPFTQASSALNRGYGGTGLGLGISKKLVDLMGGNIGANSVLGEGSNFWVEIPFDIKDVLSKS